MRRRLNDKPDSGGGGGGGGYIPAVVAMKTGVIGGGIGAAHLMNKKEERDAQDKREADAEMKRESRGVQKPANFDAIQESKQDAKDATDRKKISDMGYNKGGVLTEKEREAEEGRRLRDAVRSASESKVNKNFTPIKEAKTPEARQKAIELAQTLNANSDYHNLKTYNDKFDKGRTIDWSEGTKSLKDADSELARESRRGTPEKSMMEKIKGAVGMKSGGMTASSRADGCATKGKTRGKMV
jgi:hypothetical protein